MDTPAAIQIVERAISSVDEFHHAYREATHPDFNRQLYEKAEELEAESVLPLLEKTRQIVETLGADDLPVSRPPDKGMYTSKPFAENRDALVILHTRLTSQEEMAVILGPSGPKLTTASLHPTIWNAAAALFDGRHYRQAVQTAGQALESHLQTIAGPGLSGADLGKLFRRTDAPGAEYPNLHFSNLDPAGDTYSSAREGAAALIRGAMGAVRNLVSHPGWPDPDEPEALEMLAVLSYVAHVIDRAEPM